MFKPVCETGTHLLVIFENFKMLVIKTGGYFNRKIEKKAFYTSQNELTKILQITHIVVFQKKKKNFF